VSRVLPRTGLAPALLAVFVLAACTPSGQTPAGYSSADRTQGHTTSSAGLPPGHADAGAKRSLVKSKATRQSCIDCHGKDGNAPLDPTYPKLGGQYADYIAHSLQLYRAGDRVHPLMSGQAQDLTDQEIADLAAYFSTRPSQLRDLYGVR
jgi:cytochrome c553